MSHSRWAWVGQLTTQPMSPRGAPWGKANHKTFVGEARRDVERDVAVAMIEYLFARYIKKIESPDTQLEYAGQIVPLLDEALHPRRAKTAVAETIEDIASLARDWGVDFSVSFDHEETKSPMRSLVDENVNKIQRYIRDIVGEQ